MKAYDYVVVGAGLYGAVFAREAVKKGKKNPGLIPFREKSCQSISVLGLTSFPRKKKRHYGTAHEMQIWNMYLV